MGKSWVAAGGRTITDEMVERWERELETGEFFDKGVTVTRRAMLQRWRLVRMDDGWKRARIGASPYDPCSLRGRLWRAYVGM